MSTRTVTFTSRSVVVNSAYVVHDLPDVFIVEVDTKTKYFEVESTYSDSDGRHGVLLATNDYSLRKGDDDGYTEVEVAGLEDDGCWICIANGSRYTAFLCWYRAPKTKE